MNRVFYIALFLVLMFGQQSRAQKKLQVITRITEETYVYSNDFLLEVNGERANIDIRVGKPGEVKVVLKQRVKNVNRQLAEKHLEALKYSFNKERERLYLRNYILFDEPGQDITSVFSSEYEITVPPKCYIKIKNTLGDLVLNGISGKLSVDIEYGKIELNQCNLEVDGKLNIGDVNLKMCNLQTNLQLNNVITRINSCEGRLGLETSFGSVSVVTAPNLSEINILAENTEITLVNKDNLVYNYLIKSKNGSINLLTSETITNEGEFKVFKTKSDEAAGNILITAEYGDVSIY